MLKLIIILFLPIVLFCQSILEFENEGMNIKVEKLASNLGVIWGMTFVDKNRLLFTTRDGKFGLFDTKTKKFKYLDSPLKVFAKGQGGLLDVQTSPYFKEDNTIYFTYVKTINGYGATTLAKGKFVKDKLTNIEDILVTDSRTDTTRHFGSRITFDEDDHIYFSIGDRGVRPNAQNLNNHAGSIIRLNLDGTVPSNNPFINKKNAKIEIYSFGHRNPQGLYYDKLNKKLVSCEHGPRGGDEINIVEKGLNYGWPTISYGREYWNPLAVGKGTHKEGMEQPIHIYDPSIAPSSLLVYKGKEFKKWNGNYFLGALKLTHLNRIVLNNRGEVIKEQRLLKTLNERIRNIIQDKEGKLYLSTDSGNIYLLSLKER
ncbi:MAG: PQQ-dependent sugar dehydrogenase [Halarcobacter sp.]